MGTCIVISMVPTLPMDKLMSGFLALVSSQGCILAWVAGIVCRHGLQAASLTTSMDID